MRISDWSSDVCSSDLRPDIQAACASSARIRGFPPHRASRMQTRHLLFCLLAGTALAACNREPTPTDAASTTAPEAAATAPVYAFSDDITTDDFTELVKTLASDEFEGRGPGPPGGEQTRSEERRVGKECDSTCRSR